VTGIQNEQAATLLMCLREVERCNIFIGCYGERYLFEISNKPKQRNMNKQANNKASQTIKMNSKA